MSSENLSAVISLSVAIIVLGANYFQWWDVTYDGDLRMRRWVRWLNGVLLIALAVALGLILT